MAFVVAVTGQMGTGKTTVARMIQEIANKKGGEVLALNADEIARRFLRKGSPSHRMVVDFFGPGITGKGGKISAKKLADMVFSDKSRLATLNSIIHPFVVRAVKQKLDQLTKGIVVLDVPLLIEANMLDVVDALIIVHADKQAVIKRSRFHKKEIERRSRHQMPFDKKKEAALHALGKENVFVVDNSGRRERTRKQVEAAWSEIRNK